MRLLIFSMPIKTSCRQLHPRPSSRNKSSRTRNNPRRIRYRFSRRTTPASLCVQPICTRARTTRKLRTIFPTIVPWTRKNFRSPYTFDTVRSTPPRKDTAQQIGSIRLQFPVPSGFFPPSNLKRTRSCCWWWCYPSCLKIELY